MENALKMPSEKQYDPMSSPRYMDIPTFMRAPQIESPSDCDVAMIGIPYDGAVTNRPGARHGPREIRNSSSMMRSIHPVTRINPYQQCRIGDAGDVPFTNVYDVEKAHQNIEDFVHLWTSSNTAILAAGGDHSVTLPVLRALRLGCNEPLGLIHIDAHTDTWDDFLGTDYSHGAPFRRAVEEGLIDPERTVQIGIRGAQNASVGWDYSESVGMRVIFMEEVLDLGVQAVIKEARKIIGSSQAYISFDIDSIDPAFAPGTGTPEVGGFTSREALSLVRGFNGLNIAGADVVEISPPWDPTGMTALVGASMMYELLCILATARGLETK
jgi:guanidinopropionase|tara:strand:+ start:5136 stop:6113 length:978 start_codon:yes stop_codon:yes gene_type:complete